MRNVNELKIKYGKKRKSNISIIIIKCIIGTNESLNKNLNKQY